MVDKELLEILACPACKGAVVLEQCEVARSTCVGVW